MKPGTFTQMYVHFVFAVKNREALLSNDIRQVVFQYISGIISNLKHKSIIVNGCQDHVHILIGLNPSVSISDTIYNIKRSSSFFINDEKLCKDRFSWQEGYGAFTYSRSELNSIYNYIDNQEHHHSKQSFRNEYISLLIETNIDFKPEFLFEFFDN